MKNKITKLLILYSLMFGLAGCRIKDLYFFDQITISKINTDTSEKNLFELSLRKSFYSDKKSPEMIITSIEPGIRGVGNDMVHFNVYSKHNGKLVLMNDAATLTFDKIKNQERRNVSINGFTSDINTNQRYTTGIRLNNEKIILKINSNLYMNEDTIILMLKDSKHTLRATCP